MSKKQRENFMNDFVSETAPLSVGEIMSPVEDSKTILIESDYADSGKLDKPSRGLPSVCTCKVLFYNKNSSIIAYEFNGVTIQTTIPNGDCIKNGYVVADSETGKII